MFNEDTITTIATAPGQGAIGIIRMSGSLATEIANRLFRGISGKSVKDLPSRRAAYGHIIDPDHQEIIDEVLLIIMRGPKSYTREDLVEIHCHGGPVPMKKILGLTLKNGARLSEPGEFTKRAFLNGRLDLSQAEAVMDIIRAKTDASLRMAVGHLSGVLSGTIRGLRDTILRMIVNLEAAIDFPEEDIEVLAAQDVRESAVAIAKELEHLLSTKETGRILREGLETVIVGKPNVGKSSLLNALLKEKRAIVTDIPGTTRDIIEEFVNISGIPLKIVDTAGIRETSDVIEQMGVEKTKEFIMTADLILVLLDASAPLTDEDREVLGMLAGRPAIALINKTDLPVLLDLEDISGYVPDQKIVKISVKEGYGLDELERTIIDMVYGGSVEQKEGAFITNVRQSQLLAQAKQHLEAAIEAIDQLMPSDCVVIDLKNSWDKLGEITGDTVGENIIDQIFAQFCIGK